MEANDPGFTDASALEIRTAVLRLLAESLASIYQRLTALVAACTPEQLADLHSRLTATQGEPLSPDQLRNLLNAPGDGAFTAVRFDAEGGIHQRT